MKIPESLLEDGELQLGRKDEHLNGRCRVCGGPPEAIFFLPSGTLPGLSLNRNMLIVRCAPHQRILGSFQDSIRRLSQDEIDVILIMCS